MVFYQVYRYTIAIDMSVVLLDRSYMNKKFKFLDIQKTIDKKTFLPLQFNNVSVAMTNGLRRIFMAEVPTLALAENPEDPSRIRLLSNKSQYNRQVLIDRFGFIILDAMAMKGLDLNDIVFSLCDPSNPTLPLINTSNDILMVTAHQHLYIQQGNPGTQIETKKYVPYDHLLMTLNPGESVHCSMLASRGTKKQKQHPQWQSSLTCSKFVTAKDSTDEFESNDDQMEYLGRDKGENQPEGVILTIESLGRLPSDEVVFQGFDVLNQKLEAFKSNLELWETVQEKPQVSVELDENIPNLVKLKILNEDHTLGNILATYCLQKLLSLIKLTSQNVELTGDQTIESVQQDLLLESLSAYRKPHPLDNYIELNVRTPQTYELMFPKGQYDEISNSAIRLIILAVDDIQNLCSDLLQQVHKVLDSPSSKLS